MRVVVILRAALALAAVCVLGGALPPRTRAAAESAPAVTQPAQTPPPGQSTGAAPLELRKGDRIVLLGNTLAERQQHFNHFETLLMVRLPELRLSVRNLGWSGDTITLQPRPLNFGDATLHLAEQRADVVIAFFGLNESFDGEAGLSQFESDLDTYLRTHATARYNGLSPPRVALVSPMAHESLPHLTQVDVAGRNRELARYTEAMRRTASRRGIVFADLFTPTLEAMGRGQRLTINGIHVSETGDRVVAHLLMDALGLSAGDVRQATARQVRDLERLRELIRVKNEEFFRRWRPLNAEYVVGRRVEPFGSVSFPPEMRQLDRRVADLDGQIWRCARGFRGVRYPEAGAAAGLRGAVATARQD